MARIPDTRLFSDAGTSHAVTVTQNLRAVVTVAMNAGMRRGERLQRGNDPNGNGAGGGGRPP
jgi:hypothetical protein